MKRQTLEEYVRERIKQKGKMTENEAKQSECDFNYCCCSDAEARIKAEADYFITFENYFDYRGCSVENQVAALYGLKRVLAMTKLAAPDVLDNREKAELNPCYNE